MVDRARKLLDSLMGRERNIISDRNACYFYSLGLCPASLLESTKRRTGTCKFHHTLAAIPENMVRKYELKLLRLLLRIYTKFIPKETHQEALREVEENKVKEIRAINAEISHLISGLCHSKNILASMEKIESKKLLVEKINESLFANNKGLHRATCKTCHGRMTASDTYKKIEKHNSGRIHKAFQEIRDKIGEIASKYNIREYCPGMFEQP